jgi:hypothetical protein
MKRSQLVLTTAVVVVAGLVAAPFAADLFKADPKPVSVQVQQVPEPTVEPSPSPSPSPSPPPPAPSPSPEESAPGLPSCYKHIGTDATRPQIRNMLTAAARKQYWTTTKGITAPVALVKAIAWQKTRWQSSIVSCDGSTIGVMQVSPKTAGWLNERFTVSYDVHTLSGNAALGAEYIQWLIKHYGDSAFASSAHPYDVLHNNGMLDMVIGAYSAGTTAIDARGVAGIPNPDFVAQVKQLMTDCPCLTY